ncbi:MAG: hypothetical protein PHG12_10350 [Sphaerochaeta sp.]|nr:hypothetical protein [Sphaerochaeta sp.]
MKKTIAILLVLVIGMVGVWAADAQLNLKTTVPDRTYMFVSSADSQTPTPGTYAEFLAAAGLLSGSSATIGEEAIAIAQLGNTIPSTIVLLQDDSQNVGKLHFLTNSATSVTVQLTADQLKGALESNTYRIG